FSALASGILLDESVNGNNGTVAGITIEGGPIGEAAAFAADSAISVPANHATDFPSQMTMELFVRIDALPQGVRAGILDRDGQWSIFLLDDGSMRCGAGEFYAFWDNPTLAEWMHVACVIGDGHTLLYVNGVVIADTPGVTEIATGFTTPLAIGD